MSSGIEINYDNAQYAARTAENDDLNLVVRYRQTNARNEYDAQMDNLERGVAHLNTNDTTNLEEIAEMLFSKFEDRFKQLIRETVNEIENERVAYEQEQLIVHKRQQEEINRQKQQFMMEQRRRQEEEERQHLENHPLFKYVSKKVEFDRLGNDKTVEDVNKFMEESRNFKTESINTAIERMGRNDRYDPSKDNVEFDANGENTVVGNYREFDGKAYIEFTTGKKLDDNGNEINDDMEQDYTDTNNYETNYNNEYDDEEYSSEDPFEQAINDRYEALAQDYIDVEAHARY